MFNIFKREKQYYVNIDSSGASNVENMLYYLISVEGKDQLKDMKEFFNKHKGIPLND